MKVKVVDKFAGSGYENGDVFEVAEIKSDFNCYVVNKYGSSTFRGNGYTFLLKGEYEIIKEQDMRQEFEQFLKDEGVFEEFVGCVVLNKDRSNAYIQTGSYEDVFKLEPHQYIAKAFSYWRTSRFGGWAYISEKWKDIVSTSKKSPLQLEIEATKERLRKLESKLEEEKDD